MSAVELLQDVAAWWRALGLSQFEKGAVKVALVTTALFVIVWAIERACGTRGDHYRSRSFGHDLAFWCYYRLGIHDALFVTWMMVALEPLVAPIALESASQLPFLAQALLYLLVGDFVAYWVHRAEHRFPWMWAFHTTHHSQTKLTFATTARFHPVEMIYHTLLAYLPLRLLGVQPAAWLPMYLFLQLYTAVQHTQIPWRLGPFYRVIATPSFHAYHHSADPAHHDHNFGTLFSLWDHLFGTAIPRDAAAPQRFGLGGEAPSFAGTLLNPFRMLRRHRRSAPAPSADAADPGLP